MYRMVDACPEDQIPTNADLQKFAEFMNMDFRMDLKPKEVESMLDYNVNHKKFAPKAFHARAYELIQEIERRNAIELKERKYA